MEKDGVMNKILVIGKNGLLGAALTQKLQDVKMDVVSLSRTDYDLATDEPLKLPTCSLAYILALEPVRPEAPHASQLANVTGTLKTINYLVEKGAFVVFPSTNRVLDGGTPMTRTDTPVNPKSEYGRQKAFVESRLRDDNNIGILRLNKVLHYDLPMFQRWRSTIKRKEVRACKDLFCSPIPVHTAVAALLLIGLDRMPGISQLSGEKDISWFDMATIFMRLYNEPLDLLCEEACPDINLSAKHTTLDCSRLMAAGLSIPPVDNTVKTSILGEPSWIFKVENPECLWYGVPAMGVITWEGFPPEGYRAQVIQPKTVLLGKYPTQEAAKKAVEDRIEQMDTNLEARSKQQHPTATLRINEISARLQKTHRMTEAEIRRMATKIVKGKL